MLLLDCGYSCLSNYIYIDPSNEEFLNACVLLKAVCVYMR